MAVVLFGVPRGETGRVRCSAGTDNYGNSHIVARLLTSSFPLCAFLAELAMQLQKSGTELHLHWLPRLQNKEADALTNGWLADFCMQRRMRFELQNFEGIVLQDLLKLGLDLYEEVRECRAAKRMLCPQLATKVRKTETLKVRDPWQ